MTNERILRENLAYDETFSCVQCGYCLPACPTYVSFGKETHSPRGRINLVKFAAEGKISMQDMANSIDLCLGCRACEIVCPTNVEYGKILTSAVNVLTEYRRKEQSRKETALRNFVFHKTLPNKRVLGVVGKGLFVLQKSKLDKVLRKLKFTNVLPSSMQRMEEIIPPVKLPSKQKQVEKRKNANKTLRIGFFRGCVMDTVFSHINDQAIRLLELGGCEVTTIQEEGCCGALQQHSGEKNLAIELAKKNIDAFERYEFDYIVNAIGGCGAALVEYNRHFEEADPWFERAKAFSEKNTDISVLLHNLELPFQKDISKVYTYQPSCHLTNVQQVVEEPIRLLEQVQGMTYVPLANKELCCGSAGIYNLVHHKASMTILDDKMEKLLKINPELIVTTNPGCHLQMLLGVKRKGLENEIEVKHLVEVLAEACGVE